MPKRVHSASDRDDDTEPTSNQSVPKRTRKVIDDRETNDLCQELYDAVRAYKSEDGRIVCENFIRLPSKRTHADYYTLIKQPIDLIRIQQKIRTDEYRTLEQFIDDIQLLLNNAKIFYRKNSNEWRDANDLSKYFFSKINDENPNRKRMLKKNNEIDNDETIDKKRRVNRQSNGIVTNDTTIKVEREESNDNLSIDPYYFEEFFTAIYNANLNDRVMSEIFLFLPSRKFYPDYYLIVTNPIDLKMIAMKIQNNQYLTLDDMENDLLLMISNAKKYNDPKSQIYKDACAFRKLITSVRHDLESALKTKNDRLRPHQREELLSTEIANIDYPEEPDDEDVIRIQHDQQQQNDDGGDSDTSSLGEEDSFQILYNAVKTYKLGAQNLIDPFMKLPKRRFHQDYYEEIKRPISMSVIKNHIKKGEYHYLSDLFDDLRLMFNNAMQYNQEGSLIYNSARKLMDVALLKAHELGYDEHKPRVKEVPVHISSIPIKEERMEQLINHQSESRNHSALQSSALQSPNSQRGRPSKTILKFTEQNIDNLYNYILEYKENNISLITPFLQLPSTSEYPDYYESIEQPIDMSMIKDKIDKGEYKREQDIVNDLNRMFNNAKSYNVDESYIYKNACQLEHVLVSKYKKLMNKKEKFMHTLIANRPSNQGIVKKSSNTFNDKLNDIIQTIKNYTNHHGRILSTVFLALPSKMDYPDYYEIIQRPIDLKRIESRQYSSIDDLSNDLQLMFDNACLYNEPGSTIYRDALLLQQVLINERKKLTNAEFNVNNVQNLVQDLIWNLFIQTFNAEDFKGRFYTDSFTEISEQTDNEPFDIVYTYDLIKQNLNKRCYRRLDIFQDDLFKVFERVRKLSAIDSRIYQDTIELQKYYIGLRNEMCSNGSILQSPALLFTENCLQQELIREQSQKGSLANTKNQNSISTTKLSDIDEKKESSTKSTLSTESSLVFKGETFYVGDFVYIEPNDEKSEPSIICIESFEHTDNEDYFNGSQFYRPNETYHIATKKFLRQEVFLTQTVEHILMNKIQGLCHVLHVKDYYKLEPIIENQTHSSLKFQDSDKDLYVCESRYNIKTKAVKKIKWWNLPENKRVKLVPREITLEPIREPLNINSDNLLHRQSTTDNDSIPVDIIEKVKETIPYDSVINEKLNENLIDKKQFYEQIVISSSCFYKIGDYVYIHENSNQVNKRSIVRIDQIWKHNDSYIIIGPLFIRPCDITNREQLIVTTKSSYEREVLKCDSSRKEITVENIIGKCSVLSLKHYCTHRLTEISECDVYVCESQYIPDNHSLRSLTKALKRPSLSSKAFTDEIWTFCKELLLRQDTAGGPFKLIDDGSFMDVDDQTNSNHASNVDGDEHQSNHLNSDTANSSNNTNTNLSTSTVPSRSSTSRKNNRRGSSARAPCGYLVFASESRKRLIKDNPGIPFGEMSRMIGDQWRRLTATERDKYEEKARERAREQEVSSAPTTTQTSITTNTTPTTIATTTHDSHNMPVINTQRMVNGSVTLNGHYQTNATLSNVHPMNGNMQTIPKPPSAAVVTCPPRTQRLVHSEAYLRYIENLKPDNQFISDWPKQLKASMNTVSNTNNGNNSSRTLPSNWFLNGSPGLYNNVHEALWSMRDNMWSDVIRIRNVLSDEW
ncbi:unnamed protein product [Rotaria magnacalcarata]|uniref:Polybromo-1 n=5 Tax=Rotaria magnacalcarata TaxID=392030 RepID=A0A815Z6Y2_9BILA|nr:unnamed protein product [Rotaria magnacalcarata]CAF1580989.1 unnamed protein product [Rotaria magnacalcarata]